MFIMDTSKKWLAYEQLYAYYSLRKHAVDEKHLVSGSLGIYPVQPFIQRNAVYTHHIQVYVLEDGCAVKG